MRLSLLFLVLSVLMFMWACRTEIPFDPGTLEPEINDTIPGDTMVVNPIDTSVMDTVAQPCDTSMVYFQSDILPILVGNCAFAGCHDPISAEHGLIMTSYEGLTAHGGTVVPYNLDKSELYEKITEDDLSDRMPPPPNAALTQTQISLIAKWIEQGALNNQCDELMVCDTSTVSYVADLSPIFSTYCVTCHGDVNPNAGINLNSYSGVSTAAKSGKLLGVITWSNGFIKMPQGGNQLSACNINLIDAWITQGALNN